MAVFAIKNGNPQVEEWLLDAAGEMTEHVIATNKKYGNDFSKGITEEELRERLFNEYYDKLSKKMKDVDINENNVKALESMSGVDGINWILDKGSDPFTLQKVDDVSKFGEILQKDEKGLPKWVMMKDEDVAPFAYQMGYRYYDPKEKQLFIDRMREASNAMASAEVLKELDGSAEGVIAKLFFPGAYEEAAKQILTRKGNQNDVGKAAAIDGVTDAAMALTPGLKVVKNPFVNGAITAAAQGAEEAGRQLAHGKDAGEALKSGATSATLAGTVPGLVGGVSGMVSKVPMMNKFSRGVSESVKSANPTFLERGKVVDAVKTANTFDQNAAKMTAKNADLAKEAEFGKSVKEFFNESDPKKVGSMYDDLAEGKSGTAFNQLSGMDDEEAKAIFGKAENLFSAAREETGKKSGMQKAGKNFGLGVNYVGSRVEPIVQGNPLTHEVRDPDYHEQDWYKKLSKEAQKLIDDAYKAKEDKK